MNKSEAGKLGSLAARETQARQRGVVRDAYASAPTKCVCCMTALPFERRKDKFCSRSCAAKVNKTGRKYPERVNARKSVVCRCGGIPRVNNSLCDSCIALGRGHHICESLSDAKTEGTRRRYLLRTRPHQCQGTGCGITTWLGQPVPLEMDHTDGDSDNNTEENLRLLCPNCHALTPTHKGKNRGHGRTRQRVKNQRYADGLTY